MTRLLLDTHALLWALVAPDHLPGPVAASVADPRTDLLVSAASAWEIATKHRLGKLDQATAVVSGYPDHLARLRATELPITSHHASIAGGLRWDHRDPFDRMIVAQAMTESLTVVTADRVLLDFPGIRAVW